MDINELYIFYFSGTGNAKRVALWLSLNCAKHHLPCHLFNIAKFRKEDINLLPPTATIVFISPIHGFNYPPITLDFINKFPKGNQKVILMNTRAGMKLGGWITPGLTGIAFFISAYLLRRKGYQIIAQIPYDMPSNWLSLHPALNTNSVAFIHRNIFQKVTEHFNLLLSGKKMFLSKKDLIQDVLVAPISLLYYFIGRFIFSKTFYASHLCDGCNICIKECPVQAIIEIENRPFWTLKCESCMHCMNHCPQNAIETSHALIAVTTILYFLVTAFLFYLTGSWLQSHFVLRIVFSNLVFMVLLVLLYKIQHLILGIKPIAKMIALTSLTFYKWWGRYHSIPDKAWRSKVDNEPQ
ncbi:MAG: EFR1 family ferrodoxin [Saprospiraceae bacterium]